jgi:hypothetical protein
MLPVELTLLVLPPMPLPDLPFAVWEKWFKSYFWCYTHPIYKPIEAVPIVLIKRAEHQEKHPETDYSKLDAVNVSFRRPTKWYMYVVKRVLKEKATTEIKARPSAAAQAIRVAEALKRLGYLDITNYSTTTVSDERGLDRFLVINVTRTSNFNKLYDAREEERKKLLEVRDNEVTK